MVGYITRNKLIHWIGLWENLQEPPHGENHGSGSDFPFHQCNVYMEVS